MTFNSLNALLHKLQQQPSWEHQHQFQRVLQVWKKVIDPSLVGQTQPIAVRRQVLWVTTATSALAQTLTLERYQFLKTLNPLLNRPLVDIRYSTAHWHQRQSITSRSVKATPDSSSDLLPLSVLDSLELPEPQTALEAFQRWAKIVEARRESLPLCPCCQGPTRPQDLTRWSMCGTCISHTWKG